MGIVTRAQLAEMLWPGLKEIHGHAYDEYGEEWKDLFDVVTSNQAYEKFLGFVGMGLAPKKPESGNVQYDDFKQGYKTEMAPDAYALGYILTHEEIQDNLYMGKNKYERLVKLAGERAQTLAFSMMQTKEVVAANVYNRAFNSSYVGGDAKELLATDHPNKSGGTWANELTTAADLSEEALEQACIDISGLKNDRGLTIKVVPKSLHIPKESPFKAERILKSIDQSGTANNDTNALRSRGVIPKVVLNHFLEDPDAWFIRTSVKGMKMIERESVDFANETAFDSKNMKYVAYERYVPGWTDPRTLFGSAGA